MLHKAKHTSMQNRNRINFKHLILLKKMYSNNVNWPFKMQVNSLKCLENSFNCNNQF